MKLVEKLFFLHMTPMFPFGTSFQTVPNFIGVFKILNVVTKSKGVSFHIYLQYPNLLGVLKIKTQNC